MSPRPTPADPAPIALWPLALLAALLPACAAIGAAWWSMRARLVPSCNPFFGIVNTLVAAALAEPWKDRVENASEWWGGAIFVLAFAALALMWRRVGLVLTFGARPATSPPSARSPPP